MSGHKLPKWLRDVIQLLPIRSQFVLSGNIRDKVLLDDSPLSMRAAIWRALEPLGYQGMLIWDIVDGLQAYPPTGEVVEILSQFSGEKFTTEEPQVQMKMVTLGNSMLEQVNAPPRQKDAPKPVVALVVDYASRLREEGRLPDEVREFFVAAEKASQKAWQLPRPEESGQKPLFNPIFWLANRPADLPYWFTVDCERIHSIPVTLPDLDARKRYSRQLFRYIDDEQRDIDEEAFAKLLSSLTHNMSINALGDIVRLAGKEIKASDIEDAVQSYRVGDTSMTSPWRGDELQEKIMIEWRVMGQEKAIRKDDEQKTIIERRVKGQEKAKRKVLDVLMRTSTGLTGAHSGKSASRPRGILFFIGPTGVGKTEMAKAITELVFGGESAYLRFDMSEFSAEHSGDRLIGAPPGYVGFDQGGELTNAMREDPFRVLLFDEIEKAHDRILDKFLQILEDGRLTDGRGETVYFSESLIIFTSNLGILRETPTGEVEFLVKPGDDPEESERRIMEGVRDYFYRELKRPELLNRIGNNFVVFDFITPEVASLILELMIKNVKERIQEEKKVALELSEEVEEKLFTECTSDLSNGGRGIGSKLEEVFVNPLARLIFSRNPSVGSTMKITSLIKSKEGYELGCED